MKKILIIGSGWEQVPMVKKAKEMGLYVIATNPVKEAAGFEFADESLVKDPRNIEELIKLVEEKKPQAVVSDNCDYSLFACAVLGKLFGFPSTSIESAQRTTNKHNLRERCSKFDIPQPEYHLCREIEEVKEAVRKIGFPVVFKPVDNRGSFGVKILFDEKNMEKYFLHALANAHSRAILVEKYIEGINLTIDGYAFEDGHLNLGIASKKILITPEQKPITQEVIYPAEINEKFTKIALENNQKVVEALGINFGATHAEYHITKEGVPYLLEIANRGGGVMTSEMIIPAISGISMPELLLKQALGEKCLKPELDIGRNKSAILHFFVFQQRGKIKKISGVEKIKQREEVLHLMMLVKEGDEIKEVKSGADRHGFLILTGTSREDVREKAVKVVQGLEIEVQ